MNMENKWNTGKTEGNTARKHHRNTTGNKGNQATKENLETTTMNICAKGLYVADKDDPKHATW